MLFRSADPWELARLVLSERARRVFGPARDQLAALETRSADPRAAALCDVFDAVSGHLDTLSKLSPEALAGQIDASRSAQKSGGKKKKKKG